MARYALILAGGQGTRFWPLSRHRFPKQFVTLQGKLSLLQLTFARARKILPVSNIYIVTAAHQVKLIRKQLPALHPRQIIVEPIGRNTCPAIALGMAYINKKDNDAQVLVMPSDQLIRKESVFVSTAKKALAHARSSVFVVFGIKPRSPHTGYGYIRAGKSKGFSRVIGFQEKPDLATARKYLEFGDYYWNSGMFVFDQRVFREELQRCLPQVSEKISVIEKAIGTAKEKRVINKVYPQVQNISIDYGIMEKTSKIALIPLDAGWNDVGAWSAMYDVMEMDKDDCYFLNRDSVNIGSTGVIGYTHKPLAVIGAKDMILVETEDVILMCSRDKSQDVKKVLDYYRLKGKSKLL